MYYVDTPVYLQVQELPTWINELPTRMNESDITGFARTVWNGTLYPPLAI
jgi:hypothetical protein